MRTERLSFTRPPPVGATRRVDPGGRPVSHPGGGGYRPAAPVCTTSGATVTCIFDYTGAPETWTVPAGVTQATFDLDGA